MFDKCLFFNLNSFTRQLNKLWEDEFAQHGLSAAHGYLLKLVLSIPDQTPKELAEKLDLAPSTVTRFVDALEKKGFVKRSGSSEDARSVSVAPTKKARDLERALDKSIHHLSETLCERLGNRDTEDLVRIIRANQKKFESPE